MASPKAGSINNGASGTRTFVRQLGDSLTLPEQKCFEAIHYGNTQALDELLQVHIDNLDYHKKNTHGYTYLQAAILAGRIEMVDILLSTGKCVNLDDALSAAISVGNSTMVDLLISYDSSKRSKRWWTKRQSLANTNQLASDNTATDVIVEEPEPEDYDDDDLVCDAATLPATGSVRVNMNKESSPPDSKEKQFVRSMSCPFNQTDLPDFNAVKREQSELNFEKHLPSTGKESILRRAASAENFKVTEALILAGVQLTEPCEMHSDSGDSLLDATERIRTYEALSSATYMALTAEDPIKEAFERSQRLQWLSIKYPEHKAEFQKLAHRTSSFAVELISLCQSSTEVQTLLLLHDSSNSPISAVKYGRLQLAVKYKQKEFIAHPNCQEVLSGLWSDGTHGWKQWAYPRRILHISIQAALVVFMSILAIFAPNSSLAGPAFVPLNRFIYSATMYVIFLSCLLAYLKFQVFVALWPVYIFVLGSCARLFFMDIPIQGIRQFFKGFWNVYDIVMHGIYLCATPILLTCICSSSAVPIAFLVWGKGLFAVASILAICRILQWFHLQQSLGPVIIAFSKIIGVVIKLVVICFILMIAFAINITFVYRNLVPKSADAPAQHLIVNIPINNGPDSETNHTGHAIFNKTADDSDAESPQFSDFGSTLAEHFWALYGYGELRPIERVWNPTFINISNEKFSEDNSVYYTVLIGTTLWGLFHVVSVIILLNMLIAMMTETFHRVQTNCDSEWKYARTVLWLYYFEDCNTVPSPFNILVVMKGYVFWIVDLILCGKKKTPPSLNRQTTRLNWSLMRKSVDSGNSVINLRKLSAADSVKLKEDYSTLIKKLIQRYLQRRDLEKKRPD